MSRIYNQIIRKLIAIGDQISYPLNQILNSKKYVAPTIIYICESNMPRLGRMLKYLSRIRTEKMVVFVHKDKFFQQFSQANSRIEYRLYRSRFDLRKKLNEYADIRLIHGLESRSIYPSVGLKLKNVPFIFDFQDLYTIYFDNTPPIKWIRKNLPFEKECLKNADGYISYSLELIPARKRIKIKTDNVLYFPFYLDNEISISKVSNYNPEHIKLVYAGNVSPVSSKDSFNLTLLNKYLENTNIYLHILPSPTVKKDTLNDYKEFSKIHGNIIIEDSVSQTDLPMKLSEFDFGFIPFYKSENFLSDTKFKYSTTLKLFNYIESGLPVLLMDYTIYQSWIINHYGIGISLKIDDLNNLYNKIKTKDYIQLKENVHLYQAKNKLKDHIYKISELYDKCINNSLKND